MVLIATSGWVLAGAGFFALMVLLLVLGLCQAAGAGERFSEEAELALLHELAEKDASPPASQPTEAHPQGCRRKRCGPSASP